MYMYFRNAIVRQKGANSGTDTSPILARESNQCISLQGGYTIVLSGHV